MKLKSPKFYTATAIITLSMLFNMPSIAQCPNLVKQYDFENLSSLQEWLAMEGDGCEVNKCGWLHNELQYYTPQNIGLVDGNLSIEAKDEMKGIGYFTSAAILSKTKFYLPEGRIEFRAKMPKGKGLLVELIAVNSFDQNYLVNDNNFILSRYLGKSSYELTNPGRSNNSTSIAKFQKYDYSFDAAYNDFAIEWDESKIDFYINGYKYQSLEHLSSQVANFSKDSFAVGLKLAVGGNIAGNTNSQTVLPQLLSIDYIKLYDKPYYVNLLGSQLVIKGSKNTAFTLQGCKNASAYKWLEKGNLMPALVLRDSILSGTWLTNDGLIKVRCEDECKIHEAEIYVQAIPGKVPLQTLINFDSLTNITEGKITGSYNDLSQNPKKNFVNSSETCAEYIRNSIKQYDVLFYNLPPFEDANMYVEMEKEFYIDVFTSAPLGSQILLQLENSNKAGEGNFPEGRHSRYNAYTTTQNQWERLRFSYMDNLDEKVKQNEVNSLVLLFAPNSFTGDTFYFDNFEVHGEYATVVDEVEYFPELQYYPNPTDDFLYIDSKISIKKAYAIDYLGIPTYIKPRANVLDVSILRSGIHYIFLEDGNDVVYKVKIYKL